jgi:uridine kinase
MPALFIGIAGPSAAGKSTVAEKIQHAYGKNRCLILSADRYYKHFPNLPPAKRAATNKDIPQIIDFDLLIAHVKKLKAGEAIDAPRYDFETHLRLPETDRFDPTKGATIIIVESILTLSNSDLVALFDKKIYVHASKDICLARRVLRDIEERGREAVGVIKQYLSTVRPALLKYIKPGKKIADLVIKNDKKKDDIDMQKVFALIGLPTIVRSVSCSSFFAFGDLAKNISLNDIPVKATQAKVAVGLNSR